MFNELPKTFIKNDLITGLRRSCYESSYLTNKELADVILEGLRLERTLELMKVLNETIK